MDIDLTEVQWTYPGESDPLLGSVGFTPALSDGVLYIADRAGILTAIDAVSGDVLSVE